MRESATSGLAWFCAAVGTVLSSVPLFTWLLVLLMVLDIAFWLCVKWTVKDISVGEYNVMVVGKLGRLGIVGLFGIVGLLIPIPMVNYIQVATWFFIPGEVLSISKHASLLGIPIPVQLTAALRFFQKEGDNANGLTPKNPG